MLQQTRVETVIPYFERFLKLFPNLPALAKAPLSKVLKAWAGLGYYARARNLHRAAQKIWKDYGGEIPKKKEDLGLLPGFGPYIAGAVSSLAFNEPVAAVDGNVKRVMARLLNLQGTAEIRPKVLEGWVESLIPAGRASDFNQAMMELGAMICVPGEPRCQACPVKQFCGWKGDDGQGGWKKKVKVREETWLVALIQNNGHFFLHRKEGTGLLGGLWQFPYIGLPAGRREGRGKEKRLEEMVLKTFGVKIEVKKSFPSQDYFFTHLHAVMKPYLCGLKDGGLPASSRGVRWVKPAGLSRLAISTAMQRMAALIRPVPGQ